MSYPSLPSGFSSVLYHTAPKKLTGLFAKYSANEQRERRLADEGFESTANTNARISSNTQNAHSPGVGRMGSASGPAANGFNANMNHQGSFNGGVPFMGHMGETYNEDGL